MLFSEFLKLGFEIGRTNKIDESTFLDMIKKVKIPRNLINRIGDNYHKATMNFFKHNLCSFQIDAGKINQRDFLVFVLSCIQISKTSVIFDYVDNFVCSVENYRVATLNMIQQAKSYQIRIVGIVTDNLPVQIKALSHESLESIQNCTDERQIIHMRCCNHLLNLAYKDWKGDGLELTQYEDVV